MKNNINAMKTSLALLGPAGLILALFTPSACSAQSPLGFSLDAPTITVGTSPTDQVFTFAGTLTNNTAAPLYLNGDLLSVDSPLSADDTPFFSTFIFPTDSSGNALPPMPLAAGQTLDVALFDVTVPTGTGLGTYTGSFEIQGGSTDGDYDLLADPQSFYVTTVSSAAPTPMPVPEASSSVTMLAGTLLTVGLFASARRKKSVPTSGPFNI